MFNEFDMVALTVHIPLTEAGYVPEDSLLRNENAFGGHLMPGDVGAIVDVCGQGEAFTVEFQEPEGYLIALPTLYSNQIRPATDQDLANDRFRKREQV